MEIRAIAKSVRISTRKISLVADMVRHLSVEDALNMLEVKQKRAALPLAKVLKSAVANAVNNAGLDKNNLIIESINVSGGGQSLKRFHASTRGRIHPYKRRSTNIRVVLKEKASASAVPGNDGIKQKKAEDKTKEVKNEKENKKGEKTNPKK